MFHAQGEEFKLGKGLLEHHVLAFVEEDEVPQVHGEKVVST